MINKFKSLGGVIGGVLSGFFCSGGYKIMTRKSALQKIEDHEKLCRIMQKQTFEQIKEVKERLARMEKMIIGGAFGICIALLLNMLK